MDERQRRIIEAAGLRFGALPEDYEGIAYLVTVWWEGALDDEWLVDDPRTAREHARAIRDADDNFDDDLEVVVSEVYVSADAVEGTGYMMDLHF